MKKSIISRCEDIIRELANYIADGIEEQPFLLEVMKRLKFSKEDDWDVLCSLMDVIDDTELAKENFLKFDLGGPTKIQDYGEQYLRLYGITNAVYLQKSAIISFIELVKLPNKKRLLEKLENLDIIKLRHIVGAHTVDFIDDGQRNPHQFQRGFISSSPITTSDSKGNFVNYNLKELLEEYNNVAEDILINATDKFINTVLKNGGNKKDEFAEKINAVKCAQNGDIVIWTENGKEPFIIKVKNVSKHYK